MQQETNPLILQTGCKYALYAVNIRDKQKAIQRRDKPGHWHLFEVLLRNPKTNEECIGEFMTLDKENHTVTPGVVQYFCVEYVSQRGTPTVVSCEPDEKPQEYIGDQRKFTSEFAAPGVKNQYATSISGSAVSFAYAFAKDLMVAEIGRRGEKGEALSDMDLQNVCRMADTIVDSMMARIEF